MSGQRKIAMLVAEFLGTYVLATAMLSMLVRTNFAFFSALAAGLVYGLMVLILGSTSGSHLNPAVTIGLWTVRKIPTVQAIVYIIVQMLAGVVAWRVSQYLLGQSLPKLASGGFHWNVVIAEGIGTLIFAFGLASAVLKPSDPSRHAAIAAISLFAGVAVASLASYALLNPAVDVALRAWSWGYVVGPIAGSIIGMNLYALLFTPDFMSGVAAKAKASTSKSKTTSKKKK